MFFFKYIYVFVCKCLKKSLCGWKFIKSICRRGERSDKKCDFMCDGFFVYAFQTEIEINGLTLSLHEKKGKQKKSLWPLNREFVTLCTENETYRTGHNNRVITMAHEKKESNWPIAGNFCTNWETATTNCVQKWHALKREKHLLFPSCSQFDLLLFHSYSVVSVFFFERYMTLSIGSNGQNGHFRRGGGLWHWPTKMNVNFHSNGIFFMSYALIFFLLWLTLTSSRFLLYICRIDG